MATIKLGDKPEVQSVAGTDTFLAVLADGSVRRMTRTNLLTLLEGQGFVRNKTITIRYVTEYATAPESKSIAITSDEGYTLTASDLPTLEDPEDIYAHVGWGVEAGTVITDDVTLTAVWAPWTELTISYETEYGTAPADAVRRYPEGYGYKLKRADLPQIDYDALYHDGYDMDVGDEISEDTTLTAQWLPYTYIRLSYTTAHGTAPEEAIRRYPEGRFYRLTAEDLPTLSAAGQVFVQWDKSAGNAVTQNTTLTASWIAGCLYGVASDWPSGGAGLTTVEETRTINFLATAGSGQYIWFACPAAKSASFIYAFTDEGVPWPGGFDAMGTQSVGGASFNVYRSSNPNWGSTQVTATVS